MSKVDSTEIGKIYSFINLVKIKVGGGVWNLAIDRIIRTIATTNYIKEIQLIKTSNQGTNSRMVQRVDH